MSKPPKTKSSNIPKTNILIKNRMSTDSLANLNPENIIVLNTDNKMALKPGSGLIQTRKDRMEAWLDTRTELVSIVVQAYNRLEKTKICVDYILKYTTNVEYELVLVDNGSTDGTLEYFKTVNHPRKKIIQITKNIGSTVQIMNYLEGRYFAFLCNDTFVTRNWLDNLLICLKSDDRIGMVVPVISNGSNYQGVDFSFNSLEEMQEKAEKYNISNPRLWHERIRLVIQMGVYKREALELAGFEGGYFHDGADNDLTFRLRRAGYKTMLCKDCFVHHDHIRSVLGEERLEHLRSTKSGRNDFQNKYFGIDAWDDVNNYEHVMIGLVDLQELQENSEIVILGVDVSCGTPILELKNKLRESNIMNTNLSAFSTDPKYWIDLKTICVGDVFVDRIDYIKDRFNNKQFDYIILGKPINIYQNPLNILQKLVGMINIQGHLLLKLRNSYDFLSMLKILGADIQIVDNHTGHYEHVYQLNINELVLQINKLGYINKNIVADNWPLDERMLKDIRNIITATRFGFNLDVLLARGAVRDYILDIVKN